MSKYIFKSPYILLVSFTVVAGLLGYSIGKTQFQGLLNRDAPLPSTQPSSSTITSEYRIENSELFIDKQKGVSFVYPKSTHVVKTDSELERSKNEHSGIPGTFVTAKGYNPPKVLWALKLEEKTPYQGRYGVESPTSPFAVWVFDNSQNISVNDWFEKYWYYPFTWGSASQSEIDRMKPVEIVAVDGEQAYGYDVGPNQRGYLKLLYVKRNDTMYLFQLLGEETNSMEDAVASSFKFLLPKYK